MLTLISANTGCVRALWVLPAVYSYVTPQRLATPEEEDARIEDAL